MKSENRVLASKLASAPMKELSETEMESAGGGLSGGPSVIYCGGSDEPGGYAYIDDIDFP
ncbi:MAG: hypothetical protein AAGJ68_03360 [Pseudomonadota bacterium]